MQPICSPDERCVRVEVDGLPRWGRREGTEIALSDGTRRIAHLIGIASLRRDKFCEYVRWQLRAAFSPPLPSAPLPAVASRVPSGFQAIERMAP